MKTYCEKKHGKIKRGDTNHISYVGYYTTKNNKKYYLRSKLEFVIAKWLDINNMLFSYESKIYKINGKNYKPDFFHIVNNKIRTIIEVKGSKKDAIEYYNKYGKMFKNIGIRYLVLWGKHINKLVKKYKLENDVERWIETSIEKYKTIDMRGKNNPRYGMTSSKVTKRKIGKKTSERAKSEKYIKKLSKSIREFYNTEDGMKRRKQISEQREAENKLFWKEKNRIDPIKISNCVICNDEFKYRSASDCKRKTCKKNGCTTRYNNLIGKPRKPLPKNSSFNSYKTKLLNYGILLKLYNITFTADIDDVIKDRKNKTKSVPKTFGITEKTIKKYFGTINNYLMEVKLNGKIT